MTLLFNLTEMNYTLPQPTSPGLHLGYGLVGVALVMTVVVAIWGLLR